MAPMTGLVDAARCQVYSARAAAPAARSSSEFSRFSWMSAPAENARSPAPVITMAPMPSSSSAWVTNSSSSRTNCRLRAFKTSGRFNVTMATRSTWSVFIISKFIAAITPSPLPRYPPWTAIDLPAQMHDHRKSNKPYQAPKVNFSTAAQPWASESSPPKQRALHHRRFLVLAETGLHTV